MIFRQSQDPISVVCEEQKSFVAHDKAIRDLIFISPTILATGSYDNEFSIKLWDVPSFQLLQKLIGHKGKIRNLQYSEKLRILASSGDECTVILWKKLARTKWVLIKIIPGKEFMTWGILFDDKRNYLFTGCSHYIEIFHLKKGFKKIRSIPIRDEHVYGHHVIYSILKYDDKRILSADNEKIIFWNYIRGEKLTEIVAHSHYIYRLRMFTYSNVQYILSSSEDKFLKFWQLEHDNSTYKLNALFDILIGRLAKRGAPLKNMERGKIELALGQTARQVVTIKQGIPSDKAKEMTAAIKALYPNQLMRGERTTISSVTAPSGLMSAPATKATLKIARPPAADMGVSTCLRGGLR